jgi:hypothetical protein
MLVAGRALNTQGQDDAAVLPALEDAFLPALLPLQGRRARGKAGAGQQQAAESA